MRFRSLRFSFFYSIIILLIGLFFLDMVYTFSCIKRSEIADVQAIIGRRILSCSRPGKVDKQDLSADTFSGCRMNRDEILCGLKILLEGGSFSGENLSRIENPQIVELLKGMRKNWRSITGPQAEKVSDLSVFHHQAQALSAALAFRALSLRAELWLPFWLALILISSLVIFLLVQYFFNTGEKRQSVDRRIEFFSGFESQFLRALPVAFVLLDEFLSIKLINRLGEVYFGQVAASERLSFARFCRDKNMLEQLRNSFLREQPGINEALLIEPDTVLLYPDDSHECQVSIQWYRFYLGDRNYLLGIIHDLDEKYVKEPDKDITQAQFNEVSRNLFRAQDDERRHLADELHDGLCQSLAALKMQVYRFEKGIENDESREDCRKARQFIAQIIEDVRRLSHDLSPVILDDLGLSGALAHLVNNFAALNDLKISVVMPDLDGCFSSEASHNIYRIVQEAVNNIAKHAQASLLVLEVEKGNDKVHFIIRDDGVGFGGERLNPGGSIKTGLGLSSMAQRVRLLGGEFSVSADPGGGCEVRFTLPKTIMA